MKGEKFDGFKALTERSSRESAQVKSDEENKLDASKPSGDAFGGLLRRGDQTEFKSEAQAKAHSCGF